MNEEFQEKDSAGTESTEQASTQLQSEVYQDRDFNTSIVQERNQQSNENLPGLEIATGDASKNSGSESKESTSRPNNPFDRDRDPDWPHFPIDPLPPRWNPKDMDPAEHKKAMDDLEEKLEIQTGEISEKRVDKIAEDLKDGEMSPETKAYLEKVFKFGGPEALKAFLKRVNGKMPEGSVEIEIENEKSNGGKLGVDTYNVKVKNEEGKVTDKHEAGTRDLDLSERARKMMENFRKNYTHQNSGFPRYSPVPRNPN